MAKGSRSNSAKKLRTQRREAVLSSTPWLTAADARRQAALLACQAAAPLEHENQQQDTLPDEPALSLSPDASTKMEAEGAGSGSRRKQVTKKKALAIKKGRAKKITVLSGKNQFHRKKRKGAKK